MVAGTVALAAVLCRLPALGTWWCLDDWGQLGRAAGVLAGPAGMPARWLSQHAWWSLTWPLLGADAAAHAWARILLHALAAVAVARIAFRAALTPLAQITAGLLFAATPVAFTPLFWASGIQELLGGVLALLAVERWLAGGRPAVLAAGILGAGALLAKESAFGLPVFFIGSLLISRPRFRSHARWAWCVCAALVAIAVLEGTLVRRHFATGPRDPYALGGPLVMLGNLGKFGWWLPTPGPVFTAQVTWTRAAVGLAVLAGWGCYGAVAWRRGRRLPFAAWACALLSLAPALPLVNQARPYMGYLAAAAGALTIAAWWPARVRPGAVVVAAMVVMSVLWGQLTMRGRIAAKDTDGLPADTVVRAAQAAGETATAIRAQLPPGFAASSRPLVVYQPDLSGQVGAAAAPGGNVLKTPRYLALSGSLGTGLMRGGSGSVLWTTSLLQVPGDAFVVCERSTGFQAWGTVREALLSTAELMIVTGNHERAAAHLTRALELDGAQGLRLPAREVLKIPPAELRPQLVEFRRWLDGGVSRGEIAVGVAERLRRFPETQ